MKGERTPGKDLPSSCTLRKLRPAVFWVSFPFCLFSFVLPIYGKILEACCPPYPNSCFLVLGAFLVGLILGKRKLRNVSRGNLKPDHGTYRFGHRLIQLASTKLHI